MLERTEEAFEDLVRGKRSSPRFALPEGSEADVHRPPLGVRG
jgi:hypothetical protein